MSPETQEKRPAVPRPKSRGLTPESQEAAYDAARPRPWWANRTVIAGALGVATAVGCYFAPPQYQVPCQTLQAALQVAGGGAP